MTRKIRPCKVCHQPCTGRVCRVCYQRKSNRGKYFVVLFNPPEDELKSKKKKESKLKKETTFNRHLPLSEEELQYLSNIHAQ